MEALNIFNTLYNTDVSDKIKTKNDLRYLSWAAAWAETKKQYPDATFRIIPQIMDELGNVRFWHDDGRTGWVEVGLTINGIEHIETLPIMDFKNKAIPADSISSTDANKAYKRCLAKACSLHGTGLHIFIGEEFTEETTLVNELIDGIRELAKKKAALSDAAKEQVMTLCKNAEKEAFPDAPEDTIRGDYNNIQDPTILENLKKRLMAVRK